MTQAQGFWSRLRQVRPLVGFHGALADRSLRPHPRLVSPPDIPPPLQTALISVGCDLEKKIVIQK